MATSGGRWQIKIPSSAEREIADLDDSVRDDAMETIAVLEEDPFPVGSILLRGYTNVYRVRFYRERYRIVYTVSEKQRRVIIERVRPRSTAYVGFNDPGDD